MAAIKVSLSSLLKCAIFYLKRRFQRLEKVNCLLDDLGAFPYCNSVMYGPVISDILSYILTPYSTLDRESITIKILQLCFFLA